MKKVRKIRRVLLLGIFCVFIATIAIPISSPNYSNVHAENPDDETIQGRAGKRPFLVCVPVAGCFVIWI